jgi:hypothetical protein
MRSAHELIGLLGIQLSSYNVKKCRKMPLVFTITDLNLGAITFKRIQWLDNKLHVLEKCISFNQINNGISMSFGSASSFEEHFIENLIRVWHFKWAIS